jgi:hypothetical protein
MLITHRSVQLNAVRTSIVKNFGCEREPRNDVLDFLDRQRTWFTKCISANRRRLYVGWRYRSWCDVVR